MERSGTAFLLGISGAAILAGILCIAIALVTALVDTVLLALATTYVQIAIAAFLFAIWFAVLALLYELRGQWTRGM
ncbi:MAG: hypothetical protein V3S51_03140 [Dehalococcoidia bacterium]